MALEWAQAVTRNKVGATLYLLHVLPLEGKPEQSGMASTAYGMELAATREKMGVFQKRLPEDILSFPLYGTGPIAEAVAKVCEEKDIDLVIMTTRGRRGLTHILDGSVTETTVRVAPCPVLVLHQNQKVKGGLRE